MEHGWLVQVNTISIEENMFPMYIAPKNTKCPNCSAKNFDHDQKGYQCQKCGFKKIECRELPITQLIFCQECGCTLSDWCQTHSTTKQNEVKF